MKKLFPICWIFCIYGSLAQDCTNVSPTAPPPQMFCTDVLKVSKIGYCGCESFLDTIFKFMSRIECHVTAIAKLAGDSNDPFSVVKNPLVVAAVRGMVSDLGYPLLQALCNSTNLVHLRTCLNTPFENEDNLYIDKIIRTFLNIDGFLDLLEKDICGNQDTILDMVLSNTECILKKIPAFITCGKFVPTMEIESAFRNFNSSSESFTYLVEDICPTALEYADCGLVQLGLCNASLENWFSSLILKIINPSCYEASSSLIDNYLLASDALYCSAGVVATLNELYKTQTVCEPIALNEHDENQGDNFRRRRQVTETNQICKEVPTVDKLTMMQSLFCSDEGLSEVLPCIQKYVPTSQSKFDQLLRSVIDLKQLTQNSALEQELCGKDFLSDMDTAFSCKENVGNCFNKNEQFWMLMKNLDLSFLPSNEMELVGEVCPKINDIELCVQNFTSSHTCAQNLGHRLGNISLWLLKDECGGNPAFSTLADYLDIDLSALGEPYVTVKLVERSEMKNDTEYVTKELEFNCQFSISDDVKNNLQYDVEFFIDKTLIKAYRGLQYNELLYPAYLSKENWASKKKMPFNVHCSYQAFANSLNYGPVRISKPFFAGIKVSRPRITMNEGDKESFSIFLTVPWEYRYPRGSTAEQIESARKLNQLTLGLYVQSKPGKCDATSASRTISAISFVDEDCLVTFEDWDMVKERTILANPDNVNLYFKQERIQMFVVPSLSDSNQWDSFNLPNITVGIYDRDGQSYGYQCSCNNDPHCITADGSSFENQNQGIFIMYRHKEYPLEVQAAFESCSANSQVPTCNCGFSVRNGREMFVVDYCQNNSLVTRTFCDDERPMHILIKNSLIKVTLPTGTMITANRYTYSYSLKPIISSIQIKLSAADFNKTSGLCGLFDSNPQNDFMMRDGTLSDYGVTSGYWKSNQQFSLDWKVKENEFTPFEYEQVPDEEPLVLNLQLDSFSVCTKDGNNIESTVSEGIALCSSNLSEVILSKPCNNSTRKKRSVQSHVLNYSPEPLTALKLTNVVAPANLNSWTNNVNFDEISATTHCESSFIGIPVVDKCGELLQKFSKEAYIQMCIEDINLLDNDDFISQTREALITSCLTTASSDVQLTQNIPGTSISLIKTLLDMACQNNCSNNGTCVEGKCSCFHNRQGEDCSLDPNSPPKIFPSSMSICNIDKTNCDKFFIAGSNMIPFAVTCKSKDVKIFKDGTNFISSSTNTFPAVYVSPYLVYCQVPKTSGTNPGDDSSDVVATGISVTLSNSNSDFTRELNFLTYNATCYMCSPSELSCNQTNPDCSEDKGKGKKEHYVRIIIAVVTGSGVFIIIAVFVIYKRK